MRFSTFSLVVCLASVPLMGCAAAPSPVSSPAELRASLEQAELAFAADTAARGIDGWLDAFADDGALLDPRGVQTRGKAAIRARMATFLAKHRLDWKPTLADVSPDGQMGYTYGVYTLAAKDDLSKILERGSFMTVWRRGPDGKWRVVADMGSEDTSPPPAAAAPPAPAAPAVP